MVLVAALLILAPGVPLAQAQQKLFLQHKYEALSQAFKTLNFSTAKSWIYDNATSDFFVHPLGGSEKTADETVDALKNQFLVLQSVSSSTMKLGNLSLHPDRMSCSLKSRLVATTKDKRKMIGDSVSVNVWKLVKGKWKLASMVTTEQRTTINGKVVG